MKRLTATKVLLATLLATWICGAGLASAAGASTPATPGRKVAAPAVRSECVVSAGFCVNVPATWQRLGDVFEDLGFVAAEPHPGADSSGWPELTVAVLPSSDDSGRAPSLDSLVGLLLAPGGSVARTETLQRTRLLLNGASAEIVRVQLYDEAGKAGDMEAVALIEGGDGNVYSVALHCAPQDYARLEPVFQQAANSWRVEDKQDSGKK